MKNLCLKALLTLIFLGGGFYASAQEMISGQVKDANGEPLIGAAVVIEGTTSGVSTDAEGRYAIQVPTADAVLTFSYVGTKSQSLTVGTRTVIDVTLQPEDALDTVVVIGYGVQKKSVVTAAISTVDDAMLEKVSAVRVDDALKGLTSGVMVTSASGQPGAGSQIRVRGFGTINNQNPLYVVDGMPMSSGIDYLNPTDIERIDVLKDAASCAVYGTRGANGVILVTTKKGSKTKDRISVNYDFYYGIQNPWRKRDVLNATEYALLMNEGSINAGLGIRYADPYSYGEGTNWQEELFNDNAPVQSHQLSISGQSNKNSYYVSASYYNQEGIIGGDYDRSNYERFTIRVNDSYQLFDNSDKRDWLSKMSLNVNTSYTRTITKGISTNSEYGSPLGSAITLSPILGVYVDPADEQAVIDRYTPTTKTDAEGNTVADVPYNLVRDPKTGRLFTVPGTEYNEMNNPLADLTLPGAKYNYDRFVANFDVNLELYKGLTFRSAVGVDMGFNGEDGWSPNYYLSSNRKQNYSSVYSTMGKSLTWQVENTLTYDQVFGDKHHVTVMLGQSALETTGRSLTGSNLHLMEEDPDRANLNFATGTREDQGASGYLWADYRLTSLFARASYNFDERYMIQATIRRDGSSRFGDNNRFAIFPSVSVGWNIKNEAFLQDKADWLSNLKLRASWGKNGNDNIGDFAYTVLTQAGNNYTLGSGAAGNETIINGVKATGFANKDLKWEESSQWDVGIDAGFLNNSLLFAIDYYEKTTEGMLMTMPIPDYSGDNAPMGNVGEMKNSGIEIELSYRKTFGDLSFNVGGNVSYLKNELVNLGNETGYMNLDSHQGLGSIVRAENGEAYPFFYGLQTAGIFQTAEEVAAHSYVDADGNTQLIQPNAVAGDVRFVDQNGDGVIDDKDRTKIGKATPDWTFGFNAGLEWKGIDFSMVWQGVAGNDVYDATRRTDISSANQPRWMLNRWTGPGSTNELPRYTLNDTNGNWSKSSDLYIKDGSYLRLKNITLGYTLPVKWTSRAFIKKLRIYVSAENLLTFTKYDGFDPEISAASIGSMTGSMGIDKGVYPQARTFYFGANIAF